MLRHNPTYSLFFPQIEFRYEIPNDPVEVVLAVSNMWRVPVFKYSLGIDSLQFVIPVGDGK